MSKTIGLWRNSLPAVQPAGIIGLAKNAESGEIPAPTVIVRMEENEFAKLRKAA